jgi:hypothetical protein
VDAEIGREIALRDGEIRAVLAGRIERVGASYVLTTQLVDPRDASVVASRREDGETDAALAAAVGRLADWTRVTLGERSRPIEQARQPLQKVTTSSLTALRLFSEGEAAARAAIVHAGRWAEAEALFASAAAEDPAFASAHMWLAWPQMQRAMVALARNDRAKVRGLLGSYAGTDPAAVRYLIRAGELDAAAVLERITPLNRAGVETAGAELAAVRGDPKRLEQIISSVSPSARRSTWFMSLHTLALAYVAHRDFPRAIETLEAAGALRERIFFSGAHAGGLWMRNQKMLADVYRQVGRTEDAQRIERELVALAQPTLAPRP